MTARERKRVSVRECYSDKDREKRERVEKRKCKKRG